jgi:hypothetical protein
MKNDSNEDEQTEPIDYKKEMRFSLVIAIVFLLLGIWEILILFSLDYSAGLLFNLFLFVTFFMCSLYFVITYKYYIYSQESIASDA